MISLIENSLLKYGTSFLKTDNNSLFSVIAFKYSNSFKFLIWFCIAFGDLRSIYVVAGGTNFSDLKVYQVE